MASWWCKSNILTESKCSGLISNSLIQGPRTYDCNLQNFQNVKKELFCTLSNIVKHCGTLWNIRKHFLRIGLINPEKDYFVAIPANRFWVSETDSVFCCWKWIYVKWQHLYGCTISQLYCNCKTLQNILVGYWDVKRNHLYGCIASCLALFCHIWLVHPITITITITITIICMDA